MIKLLAVAHNTDKGIEVGVYPVLLGKEHPLSSVRDSFNAVFVHGDAVMMRCFTEEVPGRCRRQVLLSVM